MTLVFAAQNIFYSSPCYTKIHKQPNIYSFIHSFIHFINCSIWVPHKKQLIWCNKPIQSPWNIFRSLVTFLCEILCVYLHSHSHIAE